MASLVKQFGVTFFEIFLPKADKVIPLLVAKREQEEAEARFAAAAAQPTRWVDILPDDAEPWEIEKARWMDAEDAMTPMRGPMAGETVEEWIMREFRPLRNPDWRCPVAHMASAWTARTTCDQVVPRLRRRTAHVGRRRQRMDVR